MAFAIPFKLFSWKKRRFLRFINAVAILNVIYLSRYPWIGLTRFTAFLSLKSPVKIKQRIRVGASALLLKVGNELVAILTINLASARFWYLVNQLSYNPEK